MHIDSRAVVAHGQHFCFEVFVKAANVELGALSLVQDSLRRLKPNAKSVLGVVVVQDGAHRVDGVTVDRRVFVLKERCQGAAGVAQQHFGIPRAEHVVLQGEPSQRGHKVRIGSGGGHEARRIEPIDQTSVQSAENPVGRVDDLVQLLRLDMTAVDRVDPALECGKIASQIVIEVEAAKHLEYLPCRLAMRVRVIQKMTVVDERINSPGYGLRHSCQIGFATPIHFRGMAEVVVVSATQVEIVLAVQVLGIDAFVHLHEGDGGFGDVDHVLHLQRRHSKLQRRFAEQYFDAVVGHGADVIRQRWPRLRGEALGVAFHMVQRRNGGRPPSLGSRMWERVGDLREEVGPSSRLDARTLFPQPWRLLLDWPFDRQRLRLRVRFEQRPHVLRRCRNPGIGGSRASRRRAFALRRPGRCRQANTDHRQQASAPRMGGSPHGDELCVSSSKPSRQPCRKLRKLRVPLTARTNPNVSRRPLP